MFDKVTIKAIMFLLAILLVTCVLMVPSRIDTFLGMPKLNKQQCNLECQTKIKKEQHAAKMAATQRPTPRPTQAKAQTQTQRPAQAPTQRPTQRPAQAPTQRPTQRPAQAPTQRPVQAQAPTQRPAQAPTQRPK
jgi:hypothetical protein